MLCSYCTVVLIPQNREKTVFVCVECGRTFTTNKASEDPDKEIIKKKHKFGAIKTEIDGIVFDSKAEAKAYTQLKQMESAGKIRELRLQPKYILLDKYQLGNKTIRAIEYIGDFYFYDVRYNRYRLIDIKGMKTPVFKLKEKWFNFLHKDEGLLIEFII